VNGNALAIVNIGTIATGMLDTPLVDADPVVAADGVITRVGRRRDVQIPPTAPSSTKVVVSTWHSDTSSVKAVDPAFEGRS
jgi:hypothetical protein